MSIEYINVFIRKSKATLGARLVMFALSNYADDTGRSFPSVKSIGAVSMLSERNVRYCLKTLVEMGEIQIEPNQAYHGLNVYKILLEQDSPPARIAPPLQKATQRVQDRACSVSEIAPNTSINIKDTKETVPGHAVFIKAWSDAYAEQFDMAYLFQGGKDGAAVKRLLKTGQSIDTLIDVAKKAWNAMANQKNWNCKQAVTIASFDSRYNQILHEIGWASNKGKPDITDTWTEGLT